MCRQFNLITEKNVTSICYQFTSQQYWSAKALSTRFSKMPVPANLPHIGINGTMWIVQIERP